LFAAEEVRAAGWGGLAVVHAITGLARSTINRGEDDLDAEPLAKGRIRRAGGGRKSVAENDPELIPALKRLAVVVRDVLSALSRSVVKITSPTASLSTRACQATS
jgi:hypothetical protein